MKSAQNTLEKPEKGATKHFCGKLQKRGREKQILGVANHFKFLRPHKERKGGPRGSPKERLARAAEGKTFDEKRARETQKGSIRNLKVTRKGGRDQENRVTTAEGRPLSQEGDVIFLGE